MADLDSSIIEQVKCAMLAMQRQSWEQGIAAYALIQAGDYQTAMLLARAAVKNQAQDGRFAILCDDHGNDGPVLNYGSVLLTAKKMGDRSLKAAAGRMKSYIMNYAPRTADGIVCYRDNHSEIWANSFFILPPFFVEANMPYEAYRHICGYREALFDNDKHLYHHIWDDDTKDFESPAFRGCASGWAAAGLARILQQMPASMEKEKETLRSWLEEIIDGCLAFIRPDGLFHEILDDDTTFIETSLSLMLAYAIYEGVAGGFLNHRYLFFADGMRDGVSKKIDSDGLVHDVCVAPDFDEPSTAVHAQAFALLMEAAAKKCGR